MKISGSIVLYHTNRIVLNKAINTFLNNDSSLEKTLYLIDHSSNDSLKDLANYENIIYISNPRNPGFGAGHNLAIQKAIDSGSRYHFVINPDISSNMNVISPMIDYMEKEPSVGMIMPSILNRDGTKQFLPKLLPSPYSIFMRKLKYPKCIYRDFIDKYELRRVNDDIIYNAPILSGCFTAFNISALKDIGLYDERFFMYFEDWDLSRRMHKKYKTIYFPNVSIFHDYESGANHNSKLFKIFIQSAIKYFNKWGWFFDKERVEFNKKCLRQFNNR